MITIIDYKAGNLTSVQLAFESIGQQVKINDKRKMYSAQKKSCSRRRRRTISNGQP
jgi:imidazoleglycerol phosphate synthase glutamine amidotransferase subunit HisH